MLSMKRVRKCKKEREKNGNVNVCEPLARRSSKCVGWNWE